MSHAPHTESSEAHLPPLAGRVGIARGVLGLVLLVILCAIMQGSFVVSASSWGRVWPSINSTKLPLPPANLQP